MTSASEARLVPQSGAANESIHVRLDNVQMHYRRGRLVTKAVDEFSLDIRKGEFVSIVGPSGCGKSTLLKIISGLQQPTSGLVEVEGRRVKEPVTDLGIVFQSPVLLDWRNILDNVLVQVELRGLPAKHYRDKAMALLKAVGLEEFANRYPNELSGGMRQRASIVRALIHDPPLLLMDEPFGALDALTREQMRLDLEELWLSRPITVVFVTHSLDEAVLLSDRVVVMTPRPGNIDRIIPISIERPRGIEGRKSAEFDRVANEITQMFLKRGVLKQRGAFGAQ